MGFLVHMRLSWSGYYIAVCSMIRNLIVFLMSVFTLHYIVLDIFLYIRCLG